MKGVYVSLNEGDVAAYEVALDAQGAEISRAKLPAGPGAMIRMATARSNGADELVPWIFQTRANSGRIPGARSPHESRGRSSGRPRSGAADRRCTPTTGTRCRSCSMPMFFRSPSTEAGEPAEPPTIG